MKRIQYYDLAPLDVYTGLVQVYKIKIEQPISIQRVNVFILIHTSQGPCNFQEVFVVVRWWQCVCGGGGMVLMTCCIAFVKAATCKFLSSVMLY